jgi:cell division protein FtsX
MPTFIAAIGGMLISLVGTLAGRVLIALGISVVTYTGITTTLDFLKSQAISAFSGLPVEVFSILGVLKVGQCISIVTSAIAAKLLLDGLTGDTFKRWVGK